MIVGDPQPPGTGLIPDPQGMTNAAARDIAVAINVHKAQQHMGDAHERSRQHDTRLAAHGTGTDPAYTTSDDHFEGMSHQEIYDNLHGLGGLDPTGMRSMRETWRQCSADIENLSVFNLMGINQIHHSGMWTGATAVAAQGASQQFSNLADETGQVFGAVGDRVEAMAWAAEAVRAAVPPPVAPVKTIDPDNRQQSILPGLINAALLDKNAAAQRQARDDAILAMNHIYTPSFPPAGAGVPAYPSNQNQEQPKPGVQPDPGLGGGGTRSWDGSPAGRPGADPDTGRPGDPAGGSAPNASAEAANPAGAGHDSAANGHDPTATSPAGIGPFSGTTTPASAGAGVGGGGHGVGGSLPGGHTTGRPGSGGMPGGAGSNGPRVAATAGGQSGNSPMGPGFGAPHVPNKKDEEREHRSPDYLRGVQPDWLASLPNTVDVIGVDTVPAGESEIAYPTGARARPPARISGAGPVLDDQPEGHARE